MTGMPFEHSNAFRRRRFLNWFPLGLAYAFLYMGRYNLTVAKTSLGDLMTKEDFGIIFAAGTAVYALSFLFNGPMVDKMGGRKGMLIALTGSSIANMSMAVFLHGVDAGTSLRLPLSVLYAINMYFQSFAAVSIVKVNAHWFHVRERGGFSGIFGTMISSGIFFAFTGNGLIIDLANAFSPGSRPTYLVFAIPALLLMTMLVVEFVLLRNSPGQAGHTDFDTGDASSGEDDKPLPTMEIFKRILTNPIIMTIAAIEFCTGILRNGVMHWFPIYAKEVWALPGEHALVYGPIKDVALAPAKWIFCGSENVGSLAETLCATPVQAETRSTVLTLVVCFALAIVAGFAARKTKSKLRSGLIILAALLFLAPIFPLGWGGLLFVAGVIGGNVAGWVSDIFFQSRRAPAAGGLYGILAICCVAMCFALGEPGTQIVTAPADYPVQPGDEIVSINGTSMSSWADVAKAVKCHEPVCKDATWDASKCKCVSGANGTSGTATPIQFVVTRAGQEVNIAMPDPKSEQRAGDKRKLKAAPKLPISPWILGMLIFFMSLCVIGTHGLLSGTATMDFGGRKGAATAVGVIDGFVYLGTAVQSLALGSLTGMSWSYWPIFLIPFAVIGFVLLLKIWNAKTGKGGH